MEDKVSRLEKFKDYLNGLYLSISVDDIKPEYRLNFLKRMKSMKEKMERDVMGGDKEIHKID
jgi:hypothetical protein